MKKIVPNFFDIQNLSNNTIVFSQTISKDSKAIIEYQTISENTFQLTIQFQKLKQGQKDENYELDS
jgi:hypothetical protein